MFYQRVRIRLVQMRFLIRFIFTELSRVEAQRHLDEMKRELKSPPNLNAKTNFSPCSLESSVHSFSSPVAMGKVATPAAGGHRLYSQPTSFPHHDNPHSLQVNAACMLSGSSVEPCSRFGETNISPATNGPYGCYPDDGIHAFRNDRFEPHRSPRAQVQTLGMPPRGSFHPLLMQAPPSHTEHRKTLEGRALRVQMGIDQIHHCIEVLVCILVILVMLFKNLKTDIEDLMLKVLTLSAGLLMIIHQMHQHIEVQVGIFSCREFLSLSVMRQGHRHTSGATHIMVHLLLLGRHLEHQQCTASMARGITESNNRISSTKDWIFFLGGCKLL